ncbi:MAG: lactate utilization protein [Bryobacterales bacterium]|nr:lactate utilization protein [Bryobacterales bacterium]
MAGTGEIEVTPREEILDRVRKALGRKAGQGRDRVPEPRIRIPEIPPGRRVTLFAERLEALGGKVYRAAALAQVRDITAGILEGSAAVCSMDPLLEKAGIPGLPGVASGFRDEPSLRAACAAAPFGITGADYGLAETGTIVTRSVSEARLISLLPPAHIAVLPVSRMLTGLDEFYSELPMPADAASSTVFITGPSRSADIEMILVRGVHGPRVIHVIVVDEEHATNR